MCRCFPSETVGLMGMIFSFLFFACGICTIFFCGFSYRYTDIKFLGQGPWRRMNALEVSTVVIMFVSFILILPFFFCVKSPGYGGFASFILLCSGLLSVATGIFVMVGSQTHDNDLRKSCSSDLSGFFKYFSNFDTLIRESDKLLCSEDCPCNLYDQHTIDQFLNSDNPSNFEYGKEMYETFVLKNNSYSGPDKIPDDNAVVNVLGCPGKSLEKLLGIIGNSYTDKSKESTKKIFSRLSDSDKFEDFAKFYKRIEEKFDCTGWCDLEYNKVDEEGTKKEYHIVKYLFSNINDGMPKRRCYEPYKKWLVRMLKAFGSLCFIMGVFQIIAFTFSISLALGCSLDSYNGRKLEVDDGQRGPKKIRQEIIEEEENKQT